MTLKLIIIAGREYSSLRLPGHLFGRRTGWIDFNFREFNEVPGMTVCLLVFVSDSSGVISLSLSDICGLQCQIIRCQNWSHSPIPSNLPINSLYLHDQQDLIRPSSMKCWDSFDKSNMLLIFLLNEKCCAAKIVCCYQFLSLLSGMTKISGHTTPHHTTSRLAGENLSPETAVLVMTGHHF